MMTRKEYLDNLVKLRRDGLISEDAFWQGIENADIFSCEEEEEE
jgi:hypothetical protein